MSVVDEDDVDKILQCFFNEEASFLNDIFLYTNADRNKFLTGLADFKNLFPIRPQYYLKTESIDKFIHTLPNKPDAENIDDYLVRFNNIRTITGKPKKLKSWISDFATTELILYGDHPSIFLNLGSELKKADPEKFKKIVISPQHELACREYLDEVFEATGSLGRYLEQAAKARILFGNDLGARQKLTDDDWEVWKRHMDETRPDEIFFLFNLFDATLICADEIKIGVNSQISFSFKKESQFNNFVLPVPERRKF